jgi:hypothetical protein
MKGVAGCMLVLAAPSHAHDVTRRQVRAFGGGA